MESDIVSGDSFVIHSQLLADHVGLVRHCMCPDQVGLQPLQRFSQHLLLLLSPIEELALDRLSAAAAAAATAPCEWEGGRQS